MQASPEAVEIFHAIEIASAFDVDGEGGAYGYGFSGYLGIAFGSGVGLEFCVEVGAGRGPVATVDRVVELYGESGGIVAFAVFLNVVGHVEFLDVFGAVVVQVGVKIDCTCSVGHACGDAAEGTVGALGVAEVPDAVLSVGGQAYTAGICCLFRSHAVRADCAGRHGLAVNAPSFGKSSLGCIADCIEVFFGAEFVLIEFDRGICNHHSLCFGHAHFCCTGELAGSGSDGVFAERAVGCEF